jgi:putative DNA primase/helicase
MKYQEKPKLTLFSAPEVPATEWRADEKPELVIDAADYPRAAREVRNLLASDPCIVERGTPMRVVKTEKGRPKATPLTAEQIVIAVHRLCQPVKLAKNGSRVPTTLPIRVAHQYLAMSDEWNLQHLAGICTVPLLGSDGSVRAVDGYDRMTGLWCANVPTLRIPDFPDRADAEAALLRLRQTFQSFPFADSIRRSDSRLGFDVVDLDLPPGHDESGFLVGLMTAVCRPNLPQAPGLLIRAPECSGSGTGKSLLVAAISAIAFGVCPQAFTAGDDRHELDKRLSSAMIEGEPVVFLDNKNGSVLRSEILASALTVQAARIRQLGSSRMVLLNTTAFVVVTGNGLIIVEDLARRFLDCRLNAHCENPEQRPFKAGFLKMIEENRPALLNDILTIWRWGRIYPAEPSFEQWDDWCRKPLVALGCRDPNERIEAIKAEDPYRRSIAELFECWNERHGDRPMQVTELADPVRAMLDPRRRHLQVAARLASLAGTRAGGFTLTQHTDPSRAAPAYVLHRSTSKGDQGDGGRANAPAMCDAPPTSVRFLPSVEGPGMLDGRGHDEAINLEREPVSDGRITVEFKRGQYVHVDRGFDAETLARVLDVLDRRQAM